jgi:tRNA1Val (adenine37-N6)-methyltransferase
MSERHPILHTDPVFKGWTKPGPLPAQEGALWAGPEETIDALSGHYRIVQLKKGHRFSTDDVLVAWYGSAWCPSAGRVLDLGSGIGSVAMITAWRLRGARFTTLEAQAVSVGLARRSLAYNGLSERFDVREGDLRDPQALAGAGPFDLITGSPPYWPVSGGVQSERPQATPCRFEARGDVEDYCKVAAERLGPGGVFAVIFPVHPEGQRAKVVEGAKASGLTIVRWRRVVLREGGDYALGLFIMQRSAELPADMRDQTWEEPALVIRQRDGALHPEYRAVKLSFGFPP